MRAIAAILQSGTIDIPLDQLIGELGSHFAEALNGQIADNNANELADNTIACGAPAAGSHGPSGAQENFSPACPVDVLETTNASAKHIRYQGAENPCLQVVDSATGCIVNSFVPATFKSTAKVRIHEKRAQSVTI